MNIEVIAVGNEILGGHTINSNAAWISLQLGRLGLKVSRHTVLPDENPALKKGLAEALARNQLVITTGGLGPTIDDITKQAAAELYGCGFRFDESVAADLTARFGGNLSGLKDQATVPVLAKVLKNKLGTASGLVFDTKPCWLILLPGVPYEAKALMTEQVLPYLQNALPHSLRFYRRVLHLFNLTESSVDPILRKIKQKYPALDIGIYPSLGIIHVHLIIPAASQNEADLLLEEPFKVLSDHFADKVFYSESGRIEENVHQVFIAKGLTLSTAESCTGGSLASRITKLPGASKYFLGGIVAYSNALKKNLLGVSEDSLRMHGAVSEQVVKEMVSGLLSQTGADYGLAVSGVAGPGGGTPDKPVGTVWASLGSKEGIIKAWKINARGNREMIIERSVNALLGELLLHIRKKTETY